MPSTSKSTETNEVALARTHFLGDTSSSDDCEEYKTEPRKRKFPEEKVSKILPTRSSFLGDSSSSDELEDTGSKDSKVDEFREVEARIRSFPPLIQRPPANKMDNNMAVCSRECKDLCAEFVNQWSADIKEKVTNLFTDCGNLQSKEKLLAHLKHQETLGKVSNKYYLYGSYLCLSVFCSVTKVSRHTALKVLADYKDGVTNYSHGNYGVRKASLKTDKFIAWMKSFTELYSQECTFKLNILY